MRVATWMTLAACTVGLTACSAQAPSPTETPAEPAAPAMTQVDRGEYLVTAMACEDCHTPMKTGPNGPELDLERRFSGHPSGIVVDAASLPEGVLMTQSATGTAFVGPWGVSYAANITGDMSTGMGMYTEQMFIDAMRQGRHMGNERPLMPPMPWQNIGSLSDEDLLAVLAYLKTIPSVSNTVSGHMH